MVRHAANFAVQRHLKTANIKFIFAVFNFTVTFNVKKLQFIQMLTATYSKLSYSLHVAINICTGWASLHF